MTGRLYGRVLCCWLRRWGRLRSRRRHDDDTRAVAGELATDGFRTDGHRQRKPESPSWNIVASIDDGLVGVDPTPKTSLRLQQQQPQNQQQQHQQQDKQGHMVAEDNDIDKIEMMEYR